MKTQAAVTATALIEIVDSLLWLLPLSLYRARFIRFLFIGLVGFALLSLLLRLFDCFVASLLPLALSVVLVNVFDPDVVMLRKIWGELLIRNFVGPGLVEEGL